MDIGRFCFETKYYTHVLILATSVVPLKGTVNSNEVVNFRVTFGPLPKAMIYKMHLKFLMKTGPTMKQSMSRPGSATLSKYVQLPNIQDDIGIKYFDLTCRSEIRHNIGVIRWTNLQTASPLWLLYGNLYDSNFKSKVDSIQFATRMLRGALDEVFESSELRQIVDEDIKETTDRNHKKIGTISTMARSFTRDALKEIVEYFWFVY